MILDLSLTALESKTGSEHNNIAMKTNATNLNLFIKWKRHEFSEVVRRYLTTKDLPLILLTL